MRLFQLVIGLTLVGWMGLGDNANGATETMADANAVDANVTEATTSASESQTPRLPQDPPDCPLDGDWEFCEEFSDEFNDEKLDPQKWYDHNPTWTGRQPGWFAKENVRVADGMLQLTAKAETLPGLPDGYHDFTTAAVKSRERVLYGYFEVRSRPMNAGASSSFWFYAQDPDRWTEIDVYEMCGKSEKQEKIYHSNLHVFVTPEGGKKHTSDGRTWEAPFRFADDFHTYGLEWNEKEIRWYVDGKVVRTSENKQHHQALTINFDSETMPDWFGLPDPADLPATFMIDYIRCWKKKR